MTADVAAAAAEKVPEKIVRRRTWIVVKRSSMGRSRRGEEGRLGKGSEGFSDREREEEEEEEEEEEGKSEREQKTREFYVGIDVEGRSLCLQRD